MTPPPESHNRASDTGSASDSVLVVEDDEKLCALIGRALERARYEPILVTTGDGALQAMREHDPVAAIVDIMIPHPDGIEICRQFRRDGWRHTIIAISARNSPDDEVRVAAAGADYFLSKPFALADLVSLIDDASRR